MWFYRSDALAEESNTIGVDLNMHHLRACKHDLFPARACLSSFDEIYRLYFLLSHMVRPLTESRKEL
jgi:hypothetical protein